MKTQEMVSIIITFVFGFVMGTYLYLTQYLPMSGGNDDLTDLSTLEQFTIVGDAYGSCEDVCPSFQVQYDGTYRYLYYETQDSSATILDGKLPSSVQRTLRSDIETDDLAEQSRSRTPAGCASAAGGIDIRYRVIYGGEEYVLDSCLTRIDDDSSLWLALAEIWEHFESIR